VCGTGLQPGSTSAPETDLRTSTTDEDPSPDIIDAMNVEPGMNARGTKSRTCRARPIAAPEAKRDA